MSEAVPTMNQGHTEGRGDWWDKWENNNMEKYKGVTGIVYVLFTIYPNYDTKTP